MKYFFSLLWSRLYPLISLVFIEIGNFIRDANEICVFIIQITIGILTIIKVWKDIKKKTYKDVETSQKDVEKKRPFLFALFKIFKQNK